MQVFVANWQEPFNRGDVYTLRRLVRPWFSVDELEFEWHFYRFVLRETVLES
jgi:hypothetical protein